MIYRLLRNCPALLVATLGVYSNDLNVGERLQIEGYIIQMECEFLEEWEGEYDGILPMDWYPERDEIVFLGEEIRQRGYTSRVLEDCVSEIKSH